MQMKDIKKIKEELENKKELIKCAKEFDLMGDPTRLKICYLLCRHKELTVGEIAQIVGVSISAVSHTLKKLKKAGFVENRRKYRQVYYRITDSPAMCILRKRLCNL